MTVPFFEADKVPIPYHVEEDWTIQPLQFIAIDRVNNSFKFLTYHASLFTWIIDLLYPNLAIERILFDTGFRPDPNGFQVANDGSWVHAGGECFGMTSFSLWFWENYGTPLFSNYIGLLGNDRNGIPLTGQDVIATRADTSISSQWYRILPLLNAERAKPTDRERFESICNIINNTKNPALVYLRDDNGTPANFADDKAHSVLANMYDRVSGTISIYDPNYPGQTKAIIYDPAIGAFDTYEIYELITFQGIGSGYQREFYGDILADADLNFNNSPEATIVFDSYPPNCYVLDHEIELSGTVYSVETRIGIIEAEINGGDSDFALVQWGMNRTFSNLRLELNECENSLQFILHWRDKDGYSIIENLHNFSGPYYPITLVDIRTSEWACREYEPPDNYYEDVRKWTFVGDERSGQLYEDGDLWAYYTISEEEYSMTGFSLIIREPNEGIAIDAVIHTPALITGINLDSEDGSRVEVSRERCGLLPEPQNASAHATKHPK